MSGRPTTSSQRVPSLTGSCEYPFLTPSNSSNDLSAFGGGAIVIGLWTYGYNIMRNLGNRITLHSPSRGFSMELGSAITVILATRLSTLP
jgi:phosphate/sulfate permease